MLEQPAAGDAPALIHTLSADNPWPGLAPFGEQDRAYFFGRGREAEELKRLVLRQRLTVLFGQSGLGKSSLLHAGLFPILRSEEIFPVSIRLDFTPERPNLFAQIIAAIADQASAVGIEAPPVAHATTLWEYFHRRDADFWNRRNRLVMPLLVFDQFEEIFTLGRADAARSAASDRLIEELSDLAEGRPPIALKASLDSHPADAAAFSFRRHHYKILLTLREDFLAELESLRGRLTAVTLNRYRLRRMSGDSALLVVNQASHLIDAEVAEQIVRVVGAGRPDVPLAALEVEPALLSVVCRELNEKRRHLGESKISPQLLEGSQEDVLSGFYESSVEDLPGGARSFIEERLLTVSGYRDSVALENALGDDISRAVIDRLVQRRLIRIEDRGGIQRIELTHDLLTGVVRASRNRRRAVENAQRERLAREEAQERERRAVAQLRRTRRIGLAFLVLALVAVAASVLSFLAQREAARQGRTARAAVAQFAVQDAERHLANDRRDFALAHLAYALRSDPDSVLASGWATDLLRRPWWLPGAALQPQGSVLATAITDFGLRLVTSSGQEVRVLDGASARALAEPIPFDMSYLPEERVLGTAPSALFVAEGRRIMLIRRGHAVWLDAETGQRLGEWKLDEAIGEVTANGRYLQTRSGTVWDLEARRMIGQIDAELVAKHLSSDGRRILAWSNRERQARVWDTASGAPLGKPLDADDILQARISPDGRRVITVARPDKARVWDTETGEAVGEGFENRDFVQFVSFSPDSRLVLLASFAAGTVRLWDVETGKDACPDDLPPVSVKSVHWSRDGRRVLIASADDARVFDVPRCLPIGEPLRHVETIESATISPDGRRVLTASAKAVLVWDEFNSAPPYPDVPAGLVASSVGGDGRSAVLVTEDAGGKLTTRLLSVDTGQSVAESLDGYPIGFTANGRRLLMETPAGLQVLDVETGRAIGNPITTPLTAFDSTVSQDGRRLLDYSGEKTILWDLDNGRPVGQPFDRTSKETVFLGSDDRVIRIFGDGTTRVWDARANRLVAEVAGRKGAVNPVKSVDVAPDGERALVVSFFKEPALMFDMTSGKPIGDIQQWGVSPFAVFSPDGHLALIALADGSVQMIRARDAERTGRSFRQARAVQSAVMNSDGRLVVTTDDAGMMRLWDTNSGTQIGEPLATMPAENCPPRFSRDSRLLLIRNSSRTARLFDTASGRPMGEPLPQDRGCAVFHHDGRHVVTTSGDGLVQVLEVLVSDASPEMINRLADVAEAVSGYRLNALGSLEVLEDRQQRLAHLRGRTLPSARDHPVTGRPVRRLTSSGWLQ